MPTDPKSSAPTVATDVLFKRMITIFTDLSLAAAYGWLACFDRQIDGNVIFHWRWVAVPWILVGFGSTAYLWYKVWPPENRPGATRKDIIIGSLVFIIPCLWWLTFPLRFLSGQHFWDVAEGLIAAAIVLSFGAWMVIRLIKAFETSDVKESKSENADDGRK
jgi:hypothetical protein